MTTPRQLNAENQDLIACIKFGPLMDLVNTNTKNAYHPHREISIDEAMVGFKGRNSMKQYMPMKPHQERLQDVEWL